MLEIDKALQLKEEFLLYQLDVGEGMFRLFNIENGDSFKLNETAYYILSLFDGKRKVREIQKCVHEEYHDIDPDAVTRDFEELLERMKKNSIFK